MMVLLCSPRSGNGRPKNVAWHDSISEATDRASQAADNQATDSGRDRRRRSVEPVDVACKGKLRHSSPSTRRSIAHETLFHQTPTGTTTFRLRSAQSPARGRARLRARGKIV